MTRKPKVVAIRKLPAAVEARLGRDYDAVLNADDRTLDEAEILARAADADAIITSAIDRISAPLVERLPVSVRICATFSVGVDHIDVPACKARGIIITNTPDVLTDATADVALLLILGAARRAWEAQSMLREDRWIGWRPTQLVGVGLAGRHLAIVGMGRIGQATARRARGFGMEIHYHGRARLPADQEAGAVYHQTLETMLPLAHVLSLHCPATPATTGMLNAATIDQLPPGAIVVNTARGTLVDDDALIAALRSGRLFAAGLDVFKGEPALDPRYRELTNCYLLPHIGSATEDARNAMGFRCLYNLDNFFAGRPVPDPVG